MTWSIAFVLLGISLIAILLDGIADSRKKESELWNNGKCTCCGNDWCYRKTDYFQGKRMYECAVCGTRLGVSCGVNVIT